MFLWFTILENVHYRCVFLQCFVLLVTICREAIDDLRRHKRDQEVNNQKCKRLLNDRNKPYEIVAAHKLKVSTYLQGRQSVFVF